MIGNKMRAILLADGGNIHTQFNQGTGGRIQYD